MESYLYPTESQRLVSQLDRETLPWPLPDPETSTVEAIQMKARTHRGEYVIVTMERYRYHHHKSSRWAWKTMHAAIDTEPEPK